MKLGQPQPESNLAPLRKSNAPGGAVIVAGFVIFSKGAGEGPLGALFAQDTILLGRERGAPLGLGVDNLFLRFAQGDLLWLLRARRQPRSGFGNQLNLDQHVPWQARDFDGAARGRFAIEFEIVRVDGVHGGKVA